MLKSNARAWAVRGLIGAAALAALVTSLPAHAAPEPGSLPLAGIPRGPWVGTSTSPSGGFNYGPVTFTVGRGVITDFKIEAVTSSCGLYSVIIKTVEIKGRTIIGAAQPVPDLDQIVSVNGRYAGNAIRGTFNAGPLCSAAGRFIARPR